MSAAARGSTARRTATLARLAGGRPEFAVVGDRDTVVSGMEYDSRLVRPGDLFVALRGDHFDGHNFVDDAVKRGAAAVMAERELAIDVPSIVAADTRATLPLVASVFFDNPSRQIGVIGITGTDGKTTTSYLVDAILRDAGHRTGMIGTVSVRIGDDVVDHETRQTTPESLDIQRYLRAMVEAGVDWAVLEATSHGLDLHRLDETRFLIGAVTNVTHEHLEHHGTIAEYRRAKARLFERVAAVNGTAIVNLDDEGAREMLGSCAGAERLTYSAELSDADICAADIELDVNGSDFRLVHSGQSLSVRLPYVGAFNVANALCATGVALAAGVSLDHIAGSLANVVPVPGRMARIDAGQPFTVIVDYAHTPDSLTKVLQLLRSLNPKGRIIAVSGSAGDRDRTKRPLQGSVSARLADVSIFTTEDPRFEDAEAIIAEIAAGAEAVGARRGVDYHSVTDRREAIRKALLLAQPDDCVLLAGKGHERSIIWGHEKRPWDEAAVARELLVEIGHRAVF